MIPMSLEDHNEEESLYTISGQRNKRWFLCLVDEWIVDHVLCVDIS